jgi:hypothetical protein
MHSITLGGRTYAAFDTVLKRARQLASVQLLAACHPQLSSWQQLLNQYPNALGTHSNRLPSLPARSHAASALLSADRLTPLSINMGKKEDKYAQRASCACVDGGTCVAAAGCASAGGGCGAAAGCGAAGGGGTAGAALGTAACGGERLVPGAGAHFAYDWQRQHELEHAKRAKLSEGERIANDTLFAFKLDRQREVADVAKLEALRSTVREHESQRPRRTAAHRLTSHHHRAPPRQITAPRHHTADDVAHC